MAASSCYGNQNAKLEIVSIAKLSKRRQACLAGHSSGHRKGLAASQVQPRDFHFMGHGSPALSFPLLLLHLCFPRRHGQRGLCLSLQQIAKDRAPLQRRCRQPRLAGHRWQWLGIHLEEGCRTIRATLPDAEENAFGVQSISNVIFHCLAQSGVQQSQRKGFCVSTKCKIFNDSLACA